MKKVVFLLIVCLSLGHISAGEIIEHQSMANFIIPGLMKIPPLEILQNLEDLTLFLSEINIDTSEIDDLPDFGTRSVIAIGFNLNNRYYKLTHSIKEIISDDTVFIVVEVDSQQIDSTLTPQPAYMVQIITIPKTDKPIITRFESLSSIAEKRRNIVVRYTVYHSTANKIFDMTGRVLYPKNKKGNFDLVRPITNRKGMFIRIH